MDDCIENIRILKLRLAGVNTPFKKNEINRELDKDTAGSDYEQNLFDHLNKITGGGNERALSDAYKKRKKDKDGGVSFSFTTKG